ncbi:MAG: hypothetical protein K1X55_14655 [Chitinophagales bacterium]|nr:hypothetical protein [Chitinophagales bacterium]
MSESDEDGIEQQTEKIPLLNKFIKPNTEDKYEKLEEFVKSILIERNSLKTKDSIVLLDAKDCHDVLIDASDWLRFFATFSEMNEQRKSSFIVYNITEEDVFDLIEINKIVFIPNEFSFKNIDILFYSKVEHNGIQIWMNHLLSGQTYEKYLDINRQIAHYHYNLLSLRVKTSTDFKEIDLPKNIYDDGYLLNFELLIKNGNYTLFEETVKSLLEIEIQDEQAPDESKELSLKEKFFQQFKGYKITNAHFKIGSKIHIGTYYYAKRLFYNSFFSNRFAFLIAHKILNTHLIKKNKDIEITLVGYSNYSDLLVSMIRKLLNDIGYDHINHDVVLESEVVFKAVENLKDNFILIVPISSTFSTSSKIRKTIESLKKGQKPTPTFLSPDINILLVGDKDIEDIDWDNQGLIYKNFFWKKGNDINTIKVGGTEQFYFIPLASDWNHIYSCRYCFPEIEEENTKEFIPNENEREEVCLLETEKNNVTPDIIFDLPITKEPRKENDERLKLLLPDENNDFIYHRHIIKLKNHYLFFIKQATFLKKHASKIKDWIKEIKVNYNKQNLIFTPSISSNSGFVNLVNEALFFGKATILQYSASDDNYQNFKKFHQELLDNAEIYFVDDIISTGKNVKLIRDYLSYFDNKSKSSNKSSKYVIKGIITIFNRLNYGDEKKIENYSDTTLHYFLKINIPSLLEENDKIFLDRRMEIYKKLGEESLLDTLRIYFKEEYTKISPFDITNEGNISQHHTKKEPEDNLFQLLLYHYIFCYFEQNGDGSYIHFNHYDDKSTFFQNLIQFLKEKLKVFLKENPLFENEIELNALRILSEPPFSRYRFLKEIAFKEVSKRLKDKQNFISNEEHFICKLGDEETEYCQYQRFKLLLRLAVNLKINYIFSVQFLLNAIQPLLTFLERPKEITKNNGTNRPVHAIGFITYYIALVQELIYEDEAKAIRLIKNIVWILRGSNGNYVSKRDLRNDVNDHFIHLLRLLVLENNFIFSTFFKNFYEENKNELLRIEYNKNPHKFYDTLEEYINSTRYRFDALNLMLYKFEIKEDKMMRVDDEGILQAFNKTMFLRAFLHQEILHKNQSININDTINLILKTMCEILGVDNGGAYFTIRYLKKNELPENITREHLYVFDKYNNKDDILNNIDLVDEDSLLLRTFKGIKEKESKKPKTILELMYNNDKWEFRDLEDKTIIENTLEGRRDIIYDNLFFLRITEIKERQHNEKVEDKTSTEEEPKFYSDPLAVITFYNNTNRKEDDNNNLLFDPKRVRFLLMLRDDLYKFIFEHLDNDVLQMFVEQEKERYTIEYNKHGIETYIGMFNNEFNKEVPDLSNIRFANKYFVNKLRLLNMVNVIPYEYELLKVSNLIEEINLLVKDIFSIEHPNYTGIDKSEINKKVVIIDETRHMNTLKFRFPKNFYKEMLFEILWNIRKYVIDKYYKKFDSQKLELRLSINITENVFYFVVTNNFFNDNQDNINNINNHIKNPSKKDGLNLIRDMLKEIGILAFASSYPNSLSIYIPIKKLHDEN